MKLVAFVNVDVSNRFLFIAASDKILRIAACSTSPKVDILSCDKCVGSPIVTLNVDHDSRYLFAGFANKLVVCWDVKSREIMGTVQLRKKPTSISCAGFSNEKAGERSFDAMVVSDKAGDITASECPSLKNQCLLAGHTASVITDMSIARGILASADRDEKIRLSRFPNVETIHGYCLGHTSVVSSICFIARGSELLLLSTGWDHCLCLWNPSTGALLCKVSDAANDDSTASPGGKGDSDEPNIEKDAAAGAADTRQGEAAEASVEAVDEIEQEKTYDETSAGHYPFKAAAFFSGEVERNIIAGGKTSGEDSSNTFVVIYKSLPLIKLFEIVQTTDYMDRPAAEVSGGAYSIVERASLTLKAVPTDVVFLGSNAVLAVLYPGNETGGEVFMVDAATAPHLLVVEQTDSSSSGSSSSSSVGGPSPSTEAIAVATFLGSSLTPSLQQHGKYSYVFGVASASPPPPPHLYLSIIIIVFLLA